MNDELEKYRKMHSDIKRLYKPEYPEFYTW